MKQGKIHKQKKRHLIQWCLLWIVIVTLAFGWKYPVFGFSVPLVMMIGMIGGFFRGRYVCGNVCPRGSFFDRMLVKVSPNKPVPAFFKNMIFRWILFAALMGFMLYRVSQNSTSWQHWGRVFWVMCLVTTGIALVLAFFTRSRAWCALCPMGTMQNACGGTKYQLWIDSDTCIECRACERVCPMHIPIVSYKKGGIVLDQDCIKCGECIVICPKDALRFPYTNVTK